MRADVKERPSAKRARKKNAGAALDRRFEAFVFDWDGTAVPDRRADASETRRRIEQLSATSADVFVVSGTHVGNVDGQLAARPEGPGRLFLCLNRGSEVYRVGPAGPELVYRRVATPSEERSLDRAAAAVVERLARHGLRAEVVSQRLNRRKIDLIPEPAWDDPPKAIIDRLLEAVLERLRAHGLPNLGAVVTLALDAARDEGIADPRVTSDVKHVEIGLTDKADSGAWAFEELASRGIGPGTVLIAGDEFGPLGGVGGSDAMMLDPRFDRSVVVSVGVEPEGVPRGVIHLGGGPDRFGRILEDQIERRHDGRVPAPDHDPAWCLVVDDADRRLSRVHESLLTLTSGPFGLRGSFEEDGPGTDPLCVASGIFDRRGSAVVLAEGPIWTRLAVAADERADERRILDMRAGVLFRERDGESPVRTVRFASAAHPGLMAMRAEGPADALSAGPAFHAPSSPGRFERGRIEGIEWGRARAETGGGIVGAASTVERESDGRRTLERIAAYDAHPTSAPPVARVLSRTSEADFDRMFAEHRAVWADRWDNAAISIGGDPEIERSVRFALFHLLGLAPYDGEAAIGARGVSGRAYGGHVFWDADVFVLPVLAAVAPYVARAMLEYRLRRIDAARAEAADRHLRGARFPWESANDGRDVTPRFARFPDGGIIPIRTGQHEEHIVADVAWAAWHYARWTGDRSFLDGPGRDLVTETARYWVSRARVDPHGRAHIYGVTGPDEYHEIVDDNAFTNAMARWNLRTAAELVREDGIGGTADEADRWASLGDAFIDGYDPTTRLFEQFAGFHRLEPLVIAEMTSPPIAADVLLGRARVAGAQVVKQADVLMLHHMIPESVAPGSLVPNLDHYGPRTAHGSSLSPAIHASLLARAGRPDEALELFRLACRLDLDDLTGTSAGGLHIATMGGVWQALAFGFAGLAAEGNALRVDPALPSGWSHLDMRFRFQGARVRIHADASGTTIGSPDRPLPVHVGKMRAVVGSLGTTFPRNRMDR